METAKINVPGQRLEIDVDYIRDQLRALLEIASPTGYTDTVVRHVCHQLDGLGVEFDLTRRGAIRAKIPGEASGGARAIVSHLDTLGAQVKALLPNGRLSLVPIGTWSARFAEGARITIFSRSGAYRGTILPPKDSGHTFGDEVDTAPVGWPHLEVRVDAFATNTRHLSRLGIEIGDIVAVDPQPEFLGNGYIVSRHLDDKAGVAIMLAALKSLMRSGIKPPVDLFWLFTIAEEVGHGAAAVLLPDIASLVAVDNGTTAPGQNSSEFGVTIAMGDQTGPFDYHLTQKLVELCEANDIRYQKDVFRFYRSDSASAIEAGEDVRTALITFGVSGSHGYERIHMHALRSLSELITAYCMSEVEIPRDEYAIAGLKGFTSQPSENVKAENYPELALAREEESDE
ncbi:MAG: osmoprotectant NAGGN system M42 family peptidase [Pseudomonadota bacterium]